MSFQVDKAFVNQYRANLALMVQQKGSRLRDLVRIEAQNAEYEFYDSIGPTEVQENVGRHTDTPLMSTPHDRRRVGLRDWDWADMVDRKDKLRMLVDPTNAYTQNAVFAFGRKMDDLILQAAFADAYTGKDGKTVVSFPTANIVDSASEGLTIAKLLEAKEILDSYDNDPEEDRVIALTARQVTNLLSTTEITNSLYNEVKALVEGKVNTFVGFNFRRTQRIQKDAEGNYLLPCWIRSKILLAVAEDITVDIGPRRDKRNSTQIYCSMSMGSTRMEEEGVVQIICAP